MTQARWILAAFLAAAPAGATAQEIVMTGHEVVGQDAQVPEEYIVEEGDTLWDICAEFFGEPRRWPTVWALNPHVTNPHWIYPGDVLRLRLSDHQQQLPGMPLQKPIGYTVGAAEASHVSLNEGFITDKEMERVGTLRWSRETRRYLGQGDDVYIEFEDLSTVRIGSRFSIYKVLHDVHHPESEEWLGQKVQMLGIVEVTQVGDEVATAKIVRAFEEIERGARVTPLMDHYHVVSPRQNLIDLTGTIVDSFRELAELGQFHLVYIDRGAKDGVQVGNRFFVMGRGDGFLEVDEEVVERLPWEQIGEALVVETNDRNSTAIITRSVREIHVGDRVEMQRHY